MTTKGAPYPDQEENAVDCIMRFAIERLKFPEERIILYGWSIGGYTATWTAMNYPSIQSLVVLHLFQLIIHAQFYKLIVNIIAGFRCYI